MPSILIILKKKNKLKTKYHVGMRIYNKRMNPIRNEIIYIDMEYNSRYKKKMLNKSKFKNIREQIITKKYVNIKII